MKKARKTGALLCVLMMFSIALSGCGASEKPELDYSDHAAWAYYEEDGTKQADLFIVPPTVFFGDETTFNMPADDTASRNQIRNALRMQLGIYDTELNVFAPYYRQASLSSVDANKYRTSMELAFSDVSAAFEAYVKQSDNRPFVLSGFSQGAEMCLRLMEKYPQYLDNMIACYLYGCAVTDAEIAAYPQMVPATGETDTGVIVCINSEAPDVNDTFTVPAGTKSICINPLNWKTDQTPADKSDNLGAVFFDDEANITSEIPNFTGAYMDETRGTLKLPDVNAADYGARLSFLKEGEYHLYDYMFFYHNLQENVQKRVQQWFASGEAKQ